MTEQSAPVAEKGSATAEAAAKFLAASRASGVPTAAFIGDTAPALRPLRTVEVPLEAAAATAPEPVLEHLEIEDFDKTVELRIARRGKPPLDVTIEPMTIRQIRRVIWLNARIVKFGAEAAETDDPDAAERLMALVDRYEEETIRLAIPTLPDGFTSQVTPETLNRIRETIRKLSDEQMGSVAARPFEATPPDGPPPGPGSTPPS